MQTVVEDCLSLDANSLAKRGFFKGRCVKGNIKWESGANIGLVYSGGTLYLNYAIDGESNNQSVPIVKAPCHFGGHRHYFTCPGCAKRRYKMRLGSSGFYCRQCYRLTYYTQQCDYMSRLVQKVSKLEKRLERDNMRTHTAWRLIDEICVLDNQINAEAMRRFGMWVR
jgi:hypothetical protein